MPIASYLSQERATEKRVRELLDAAKIRFITVGSRGLTVNAEADKAKPAREVLGKAVKDGTLSVQLLDQLLVPKNLRAVRTDEKLRSEEDSDSIEEIVVPVAPGLIRGNDCELSVNPGKERIIHTSGTYTRTHDFTRNTDKIPQPGESYEVELAVKWFETDAPVQPGWKPESGGKHKVLLTRSLKLSVGPENIKPGRPPDRAKDDKTRVIYGVVKTVDNDSILLTGGERVLLNEKTGFLRETGLDAAPAKLADVTKGKSVYIETKKEGQTLVAIGVVLQLFQEADLKPADEKLPPKNFTNSIGMKFVWIPPGTFMMGSPKEEELRSDEETQHKVTLTKGFYMGVDTVTQEQWQAVMGNNPSKFKGEKNVPVEMVSWDDCQKFIKRLREKDKKPYRLPTEAEWEYACRAGTTTPFHFGGTISSGQANYNGNYTYGNGKKGVVRQKTTPAGSFPANAWGLHDMHGNVFQWCQDWHGAYPQKDVTDPQGADTEVKYRVLRGGSWNTTPWGCRSASRFTRHEPGFRSEYTGLRVCFWLE